MADLHPVIDVPVTVNIQLSDPAGNPLTTTTPSVSGSTYSSMATISSFGRNQSGVYTCTATVSPSPSNKYVNSSSQSEMLRVTTGEIMLARFITIFNTLKIAAFNNIGVFLSHNGMFIADESYLSLSSNDNALLCFTDLNDCCTSDNAQVTGNWLFPNGSIVGNQTTNSNIYTERGPSVVGLYWNDGATFPVGVYRCVIPDASQVLRNVSVRIYFAEVAAAPNSAATVAGAIVGVLLALVLIVAVSAMVVIFGMGRLAVS
jgi:hypothetical protein